MARLIRADARSPGLVPAVVASAHERARALVEDAQRAADAVRARAEQQGRSAAQAELALELVRLGEARDRELASLRAAAIELGMQAARRLLGHELTLRPELIAGVVGSLLPRLRRARSVTVRVHPDDREALERALPSLRDAAAGDGTLRVETDPGLARGGCVIHSDVGSLDARVETQLGAIERALKKPR